MTPGFAPGWKEQLLEGAGSPELGQPLRTPASKVMTGVHLAGLKLSQGRECNSPGLVPVTLVAWLRASAGAVRPGGPSSGPSGGHAVSSGISGKKI